MAFSICGCSFIGTLLASSKKKKKSMYQIHKEEIVGVGVKSSKNIIEEKIVASPFISIKHMDVDRVDGRSQAMKIDFPEDVIGDILSRLPVRSLLRFKCASIFWNSLISEPYFKTKHWNHAKNNQKFQKFLICQFCPYPYDMWVGTKKFYCSSVSSVQRVEDVQELGFPSNDKQRHYEILCSCDGLSLPSCDDYLLWNPSTNESVVLPDPEFSPAYDGNCGLGYDSTSDDYKILMIDTAGYGSNLPNKILALKIGSWRKIDNHPRGFHNDLRARDKIAFVHGAFHRISKDILSKYFMVSFNISNEAHGEIPLPEGICDILNTNHLSMNPLRHGVSVLEGMLCAYCTYRNTEASTFKLWVMKEYGVKESWTELCTLRETNVYSAIPVYRFADGEVLLYYDGDSRYNSGFRTSKGPYGVLPETGITSQIFCYTESLISPKLLA